MKEIIIATKNRGKAKEFVDLFHPLGFEVKTLLDFPDAPDIEETGKTFEENAILKAEGISRLFQTIVIADDSGLIIDALNGRPGVYSARYAGEEKSDEANIEKVLTELEGISLEKRTARFHCTLALARPNKETVVVSGECEGVILKEKRGASGFGYDPIFYVEEKGKTLAEMTPEEKNSISHRGQAIQNLRKWIEMKQLEGEL